jgi:hypothetical protein
MGCFDREEVGEKRLGLGCFGRGLGLIVTSRLEPGELDPLGMGMAEGMFAIARVGGWFELRIGKGVPWATAGRLRPSGGGHREVSREDATNAEGGVGVLAGF